MAPSDSHPISPPGAPANSATRKWILDLPRALVKFEILYGRKIKLFKRLYDFTFEQCGYCVESGCACKDRICQHVEEQANRKGEFKFGHTGHALRFIGKTGCVIAPHLRETCTIFLCEKAQKKSDFDHLTYAKLKRICSNIDWGLMTLEDEYGESEFREIFIRLNKPYVVSFKAR